MLVSVLPFVYWNTRILYSMIGLTWLYDIAAANLVFLPSPSHRVNRITFIVIKRTYLQKFNGIILTTETVHKSYKHEENKLELTTPLPACPTTDTSPRLTLSSPHPTSTSDRSAFTGKQPAQCIRRCTINQEFSIIIVTIWVEISHLPSPVPRGPSDKRNQEVCGITGLRKSLHGTPSIPWLSSGDSIPIPIDNKLHSPLVQRRLSICGVAAGSPTTARAISRITDRQHTALENRRPPDALQWVTEHGDGRDPALEFRNMEGHHGVRNIGTLGEPGKSKLHVRALGSTLLDACGQVADTGLRRVGEIKGCGVDEADGEDIVAQNSTDFALEGGPKIDAQRRGLGGSTSYNLLELVARCRLVGLGRCRDGQHREGEEGGELHRDDGFCMGRAVSNGL